MELFFSLTGLPGWLKCEAIDPLSISFSTRTGTTLRHNPQNVNGETVAVHFRNVTAIFYP